MRYFRQLKTHFVTVVFLLTSLFLASCDELSLPADNAFGCTLKPYTVGAFATGDLATGDCLAVNSQTTLIDYHEFALTEVDTVVVSLDKGTPNLYQREGRFLGNGSGGTIRTNLGAGTYVIGVANNGTLNYTISSSATP